MARWIDEEKEGILNTRPPPSPQYPEVKEDDEVVEVIPPIEVPEQAPLADVEEEEIASNPPPTEAEEDDEVIEVAPPIKVPDQAPLVNANEEEIASDPPLVRMSSLLQL